MDRKMRTAAVLGSGVMGSAIAAHLANVGLEVYLLDVVPKDSINGKQSRNQLAERAIKNIPKQKPIPIYSNEVLLQIHPGNFEDDLSIVSEVDWVVEAVIENLSIKQELLAQVEKYWQPGTIVSSNTSGISIHEMVKACSESFRNHFLGTHFFNPPRYMKLLEIIPTTYTNPDIVAFMIDFCTNTLGKGVVQAKDTPNFIANRIGVYGLMVTLKEMEKYQLSIEEVDSLTGPILGRPKSATFRTLDLVGVDTFVHVARNVHDQVKEQSEKEIFDIPNWLDEMVRQDRLGDKTGQGFYCKKKSSNGTQILQLNMTDGNYMELHNRKIPSLESAKNEGSFSARLKSIIQSKDPAGLFVWNCLKKVLLYAAEKIPEIAEEPLSVDLGMKWGFNWDYGPFELWDLIGLASSIERMEKEGEKIPKWVKMLVSEGRTSFYIQENNRRQCVLPSGVYRGIAQPKKVISLKRLKEQGKVIKQNSGATLIDIGDDVACLEFHSPNNAIGQDILQMIRGALHEVRKNYRGLVIGNEGKNFCVGANLMLILMEAQDENWFEIEQIVREFQSLAMEMKYFEKPIVSAPFSMTLGGGVEMCLPASMVQASAETYMGLVETGVGLIPGGGGTKEMLLRATKRAELDGKNDLQPYINKVFETIAMAKVSSSGHEAKQLGYLQPHDRLSINRDHLLYDAKQLVIGLSKAGYQPPRETKIRVVGEAGYAVLRLGIYQMKTGGFISDHDALIATKLAKVLCGGGDISAGTQVSERYLLDLEREVFLSLCGEAKSQARMQHMLLKGKPLRN